MSNNNISGQVSSYDLLESRIVNTLGLGPQGPQGPIGPTGPRGPAGDGEGGGRSLVNEIYQQNHGLSVGEIVYQDKNNQGVWTKSLARNNTSSEVVGIVSQIVDVNNFTLITHGYVEGLSNLIPHQKYFLSDVESGGLSEIEPSEIGYISKPVFYSDSTSSGWFINHRGIEIDEQIIDWTQDQTLGTPELKIHPNNLTVSSDSSTRTITQVGHSLVPGDLVFNNVGTWTKSRADQFETGEVIGIVSKIDGDNFTLLTHGYIEDGLNGLTPNELHFLSDSQDGKLTDTSPNTVGYISKPVLYSDSDSSGYFINYRGMMIDIPSNGSSSKEYKLLNTTSQTDAYTELYVNGQTGSGLILPENTTWFFTLRVAGRETGGTGNSGIYKFEGGIDRSLAGTTLIGTIAKTTLAEDNLEWDVTLEADNLNNSLLVKVKGTNTATIKWSAAIEIIEVTE